MRASLLRFGSIALSCSAVLLAHCSGSDTPTASDDNDTGVVTETGGDETSATETGAEAGGDETGAETGGDETGAETGGDTGPTDATSETAADGGCGALGATAVDVYVDKAAAGPSVGTAACPFHTIKEATDLAAVSGRTIHVKGGDYTEAGALVVKNGVTLLGDGVAKTKITNSGDCTGGNKCAVEVQNNGKLEGFTITSTDDGVVTGAGDGAADVKNVLVTGAQDGILALGQLKLHGVQLNANKQNGLHANATSGFRVVTIDPTGAASSSFDSNDGNGILVEGQTKLDATTGSASSNKGGGIYLHSTVTVANQHLVTSFTVKSNGADGIHVTNTSSLKLRSTVTQANTHHGLAFTYSVNNALDISSGGNSFSSATASLKNGAAAMCLQNSGATGSQDGNGNKWAACGVLSPVVSETSITVECSAYATQTEIAYKKSASGGDNPVAIAAVTGCTTAP